MITIEWALLVTALLLIFSVIASKASARVGVPALLIFLLIGMLAGPEGLGGIDFNDLWLAQSIGVVALALILFSGGLDTNWESIRSVLWSGLALANVGVVVSAVLVGGFAVLALGFAPLEGLLFGAIVSSTDAAAVFSVMRTRSVNLKGKLEPLIELESGSNDPIAVFLTIGLTGMMLDPTRSALDLVPTFVWQMTFGAAAGYGLGRAMVIIINRLRLSQEGLYPVLSLALVLLTYGLTTRLGGNGFLAVYIAGLTIGNRNFIHKRSLMRFHDGLAWLMQIGMFLTLGMLVIPSRLPPVLGSGVLAAVFLILAARPVGVFAALAFTKLGVAEKLMVAWAGLRGAVPIVLATFPLLAGLPRAEEIFNLVFFIVLLSVALQGTSVGAAARLLRLNAEKYVEYHYPLEFVPSVSARSQLIEILVRPDSPVAGCSLIDLNLPRGVLVVSINRQDDSVVPDGGTVLEVDDRVLMLAEREAFPRVRAIFGNGASGA